jgi:hypothetical protein
VSPLTILERTWAANAGHAMAATSASEVDWLLFPWEAGLRSAED